MIFFKRLRQKLKIIYYKRLCFYLDPDHKNNKFIKTISCNKRLVDLLPGSQNSAVILIISGDVTGVGFTGWLTQKARINNVKTSIQEKQNNFVEAILIGSQKDLEALIRLAWKGPQKAKVQKVKELWFNKSKIIKPENIYNENRGKEHFAWSKETADKIRGTLNQLKPIMDQPNSYDETERVSGTNELLKEALAKNLFASKYLNKELYVVSPFKEIGFQRSQTTNVSSMVHALIDHKHLTKEYLARKGLPVPRGRLFSELQAAKEYLKSTACPLVVKPAVGLNGSGVTVDVRTEEFLEEAWAYAKNFHDEVILEELVEGVDIRVIVIGGKACSAYIRVPANVIGDGKQTIEELMDAKNRQRLNNPRLRKTPIIPDSHTASFLHRQGLDYDRIPAKGQIVFFHLKANISKGGDTINVDCFIHPDLLRLAEEAVSAIGIDDFWGLDLLVERIDLPRAQQKCVIIELNSTANIESVNFPFYGQRYNAALTLIEHVFPGNVNNQDYPMESVEIELTGFLNYGFLAQVNQLVTDLMLNGSMRFNENIAELVVKGRKHHIVFFVDGLIDWRDKQGEAVDNMQVNAYEGDVGNGFSVEKVTGDSFIKLNAKPSGVANINLDQMKAHNFSGRYSDEANDLNARLFSDEFTSNGLANKELYSGLFELSKDNSVGFTSMYHSSLFCDKICDRLYPVRKLLVKQGLPVPRCVRLRSSRIEEIEKHFDRFSGGCLVTVLNPGVSEQYMVHDSKKLRSICKKARKKGSSYLLLEERIEGWNVCVAVVGDKAAGSLIITPVRVKGNGRSTISELIEEKNYQRSLNPWFKHFPIFEDECLLEVLTETGYRQEDILADQKTLHLETEMIYEFGGETFNSEDILHPDFNDKAVQAVNAIPGLDFAYVHMIIPRPDLSPEEQGWAILKIDTNPKAAMFHFPWRGESTNLVQCVVNELCLTERTLWS